MSPESCLDHEIDELLPWYVNATLGDEEQRRVETHIAGCSSCQGRVEELRQLSVALRAENPLPGHDLYARTASRLERGGLAGLWLWRPLRQVLLPIPGYARVAIAAQLIVIGVLGAVLLSRGPVMSTLSDGSVHSGPAVRLQVVFSGRATAEQIQKVLSPLNARIVDGPTSTGVYQVEVPLGSGRGSVTAVEMLRTFRASPLIEFVAILEER